MTSDARTPNEVRRELGLPDWPRCRARRPVTILELWGGRIRLSRLMRCGLLEGHVEMRVSDLHERVLDGVTWRWSP